MWKLICQWNSFVIVLESVTYWACLFRSGSNDMFIRICFSSLSLIHKHKVLCLPSKWENLSCYSKLINMCLQVTTTSFGLQEGQVFCKYVIYIIYFNFGHGFCGSFAMSFPEDLAGVKHFVLIFAAMNLYLYELGKYVSDF